MCEEEKENLHLRDAFDCPFCGSKKLISETDGSFSSWIECESCEARGPQSYDGHEAVYKWNRNADGSLRGLLS